MLYAGLKVIDPNTSLPKFVLINWVCILLHLVILSKNNNAKLSSLILPSLLSLFMKIISTTYNSYLCCILIYMPEKTLPWYKDLLNRHYIVS